MSDFQSKLDNLFSEQQSVWPFFKEAVESLKNITSRSLILDGTKIILQNNPARIKSTAANIDNVEKRACFLCATNRPKEQFGFDILGGRYEVLVNPYPILSKHFTVVSKEHSPQVLEECLEDFLLLTTELPESAVLIFNGAKAGASAPDHKHFQILQKADLPFAKKLNALNFPNINLENKISFCNSEYFVFRSSRSEQILSGIQARFSDLVLTRGFDLNLLNLIAWKEAENLSVTLIPRRAHRPSCFYASPEQQIMISPAAIELSGVIVLPRIEDFDSLKVEQLEAVFREVCYPFSEK